MGKSRLRAVSVVLLLVGLLAGTADLTAAPPAGQAEQHVAAALLHSVSIPANADACLKANSPSYNSGISPFLDASYYHIGGTLYVETSLVRFDLASNLPANAIIDSASLGLKQTSCTDFSVNPTETYVAIYFVNQSWTEGSVTWSSRPASASIGLVQLVTCSAAGLTRYYYNVTSFAQAWHDDPQSNYGIEVRGPWSGDYQHVFASREAGGNGPSLIVNYHLPSTTPTPTPTPTPVCW